MTRTDLVSRTGTELRDFDPSSTVAVLPIGAIEFHGPHLPLGTDGYLAEAVCRAAATGCDAALLPTQWVATGMMPKSFSIGMSPATAEAVLRETSRDLLRVGFAGVVCFSGHYSFAQRAMLARYQAVMLESSENCHAVTLPDLLTGSRTRFYDHAGLIETSLMLVARPELTALETVAPQAPATWQEAFRAHGISGDWPSESSVEKGQDLIRRLVERLSVVIATALAGGKEGMAAAAGRLEETAAELGRIDPTYEQWIRSGVGDIEEVWEAPFRGVTTGEDRWFRCCTGGSA